MADNKELRITIIGLGLIGGSLAKAIRQNLSISNITAIDSCSEYLDQAMEEKTIFRGLDRADSSIRDSDIIFICTPVNKTFEYVNMISGNVRKGCIITDVGSTKSGIMSRINNMCNPLCFIGGHPMTGSEKSGYSASSANLFENAYYVLTPGAQVNSSKIEFMKEFISAIGAFPIVMDPDEHDRVTGAISHVPHVIAAGLVNLVHESDTSDGIMKVLAAGGFKDITRIASSDAYIWRNITLSNKKFIADMLYKYMNILNEFCHKMNCNNEDELYNFFAKAKDYRSCFSSTRKGPIPQNFEIVVDVEDKPGIIGEIATLLGDHGINIKNINISNSREFELGCLTITLVDQFSMDKSVKLLQCNKYKVFTKM